jgi:hypothetical protein
LQNFLDRGIIHYAIQVCKAEDQEEWEIGDSQDLEGRR